MGPRTRTLLGQDPRGLADGEGDYLQGERGLPRPPICQEIFGDGIRLGIE